MDTVIDLEELPPEQPKGRKGDGGVYLIVADETDEFPVAMRFAARLAVRNRGYLGILRVIENQDFQHWGNVESRMRQELRQQGEMFLWNVAKKVNDLNGLIPVLYIREGDRNDALVQVINEDTTIRMLVLAAGTNAIGPGPLVSYFTGRGTSRLRVPVLVVPGHLDQQKIDAIA